MTSPLQLPRRDDDTPPDWWVPYTAHFPRWRAWRGAHRYWVRLPGTMRVYHADDPADLASQIRAAATQPLQFIQVRDYRHRPMRKTSMSTDEFFTPTTIPSPARIYDYYLGGKDNYAIDRAAAEKALSVVPHGRQIARANRDFLIRAVTLMAEHGISQFIDLGTGFPTSPNVHQAARAIDPDTRVAYIDNDPIVTTHNQALLAKDDKILALHGDIRHPYTFLGREELWKLIDFTQPIGVLLVAVLHFIPPEDDPEASVATLIKNMVSGSYLALSHITSDGTAADVITTIRDAYRTASAPAVFRTREQILQFFDGLQLIEPGLADLSEWRTSVVRREPSPPALRFLAGIATKP